MQSQNILFHIFVTVLFSIFQQVDGAQLPICNQIHLFGNIFNPHYYDSIPAFNYSLDLTITTSDAYHTMLKLDNLITSSTNASLYYQDKPIRYYAFKDRGSADIQYTNCPSLIGPCNIEQFDADSGSFQIPVYLDGYNNLNGDYSSDTLIFDDFIFDSGTLFNVESYKFGYFFDPNTAPCYTKYIQNQMTGVNDIIFQQYCCTNYNYITVPDNAPPSCVQFQSNTTFTTSNNTVLSVISAQYALTSIGIEYSLNPEILSLSQIYNFYPNMEKYIKYGYSKSWTKFDFEASNSSSDFEYKMMLSIINWDSITDDSLDYAGITIPGKIIRRNGILFKDQKNQYTPESPCSNTAAPEYFGSKAINNFCCSKFQLPDLSSKTCAEYQSITKVYTNDDYYYNYYKGSYFNIKYKFTTTSLILSILSYDSPQNSTLQIETYSGDTFGQTCQVSTTSPQKTCVFRLSETNYYQFQYRTSINPNSIQMTTVSTLGSQITDPNLTPSQPCQAWFTDALEYNQKDTATTELCCITQPNGPWPGGLTSFGYFGHFS